MNMELGAAIAIFNNCFRKVEEDEYIDTKHGASYSVDEIIDAIYKVAHMATYNSISKESIVNALRYIVRDWYGWDE